MQPQLTGSAKAAIFLLSLEQEETIHILEHLEEREVRQLRQAVEQLQPVSADVLDQIYRDFSESYRQGWTSLQDGDRYLKELVRRAQGEERAEAAFAGLPERPALPEGDDVDAARLLSTLTGTDPAVLRFTIAEEHPQIAAAVLAHLEPGPAAEILHSLNPTQQADLLLRIAMLEPIPVSAFTDAAASLRGMEPDWSPNTQQVDGMSRAAGILGEMAAADANSVIEQLAEEHPDEAARLQRALFTMENLMDADTRGLQQLLKEVQTDTLLVALKTASDPLRDKFFGCMSKRAAEMLHEEAEMLPPIRLSEVEAAQQQIVEAATRLMAEGKLHVKGRGEDLV